MSKCAVDNGKMYDIKIGSCEMALDDSDQFYKTVSINLTPINLQLTANDLESDFDLDIWL